jgi:hypothetical protein
MVAIEKRLGSADGANWYFSQVGGTPYVFKSVGDETTQVEMQAFWRLENIEPIQNALRAYRDDPERSKQSKLA